MRHRSPAMMIAALPIRRKISGIVMLTTFCALLLACGAFILYDYHFARRSAAHELDTLAGIVASNSAAALMFKDVQACSDILSGLQARRSIVAGAIYTNAGQVLANYGTHRAPTVIKGGSAVLIDRNIQVSRTIRFRGEAIGTLYLESDLRELRNRMRMQMAAAGVILTLALLVALAMTSRLQGFVTGPLLDLAGAAQRVTREKDYSVRVPEAGRQDRDEIGLVMQAFNEMLTQIEHRDEELGQSRADLERQVLLRTAELTGANEELLVAKNTAEKAGEINAQLARESALILNSATDGILGIGLDNHPTFLNPAGARILGMTLSDFDGKSVHAAIHHSYPDGTPWPEADCENSQALRGGESLAIADVLWRPDGTSFPAEYSSTPMFDESGNQIGAVMMFRDVTERRAIERMKSEFVSTVSHELRTPLTSIRGALGLLGSGLLGPIAEKGQRMLDIAVTNTDRLVRLINDILDLERIESGKVELVRTSVDAHSVMVQALEGVQAVADQAGVRLVVEPATGTLFIDSDRIIQTLTNLLGNAIKFSPPGTTVTLSGAVREGRFLFCVADQGRGVPREKLGTIFERFSQVDSSDSRDKGGSGLGLAICRSIVEAHDGQIWAESNAPVGTRFQFTIPLALPSDPPAASEAPYTRTILVCHQNPTSMVAVLEEHGFLVLTAATCVDMIARAGVIRPDAILLDLTDGSDGLEMVSALEASSATHGIPVLIVAAQIPEASERDENAIANWVRSPWKNDDLLDAVERACAAPSVLVVEDDLDLARVMTTALQGHGFRTFHSSSGADAVDLGRQHQPSLIVLDLGLPDMDGFAVVSVLRESATLARTPLLVYSALDVGMADQARLRLGPTEFLTKSRSSLAEFERQVVRLLATAKDEGQHAA